jgi:hypothetical protein
MKYIFQLTTLDSHNTLVETWLAIFCYRVSQRANCQLCGTQYLACIWSHIRHYKYLFKVSSHLSCSQFMAFSKSLNRWRAQVNSYSCLCPWKTIIWPRNYISCASSMENWPWLPGRSLASSDVLVCYLSFSLHICTPERGGNLLGYNTWQQVHSYGTGTVLWNSVSSLVTCLSSVVS